MSSDSPTTTGLPTSIDGRYLVKSLLGRGGMASVFAAFDSTRQRDVALKQLTAASDSAKQSRNHELFEREFHVLSQLAHPSIVQVYDFASASNAGAYYTMELLGGRDLHRLAPMRWRDVCAMARDICSALSLLHSRRLVHRDVSPRNVYWHDERSAKLIDFGVVATFGPAKLLVGTPPCCAPESVHMQAVDGRSDLFALGATMYFALTGRHAYGASRFADLHDAWRHGFAPVAAFVADLPRALETLVVELLQLDRDARPSNAADVIERLLAIDSTLSGEAELTSRAYLRAPPLVGRDAEVEHIRSEIAGLSLRAVRNVIVEGAAGTGRTRLVDAGVLCAMLAGVTVVRGDAYDAKVGDYGVARALARRLFELLPAEAADAATAFQPSIASIMSEAESAVAIERAALQRALRGWLLELHHRRPLVLAVDDIHLIDEPSASLLALIGEHPGQARPFLLLSAESGATWTAPSARKLLEDAAVLSLSNLSAHDCERLLQSLFGEETPNLDLLAARTFPICAGNPDDLLQLVQHLIDRGTIRYAAGAWTLPFEIDSSDLPESLAQALASRIERLDPQARHLARALALCPEQGLSLDECSSVCGEANVAQLMAACEQLSMADIGWLLANRVSLTHPSWIPLLRAALTRSEELALEAALAQVFERRADAEVRAAQHWLRAGRVERAVDLLVAHSVASQEKTARAPELFAGYLRTLPSGWFETFDRAIRACAELDRPKRHEIALLSRLSGILPMLNMFAPAHTMTLFARLKHDSGLEDWEALAGEADPKQRLVKALSAAGARFEATPEHERVYEPKAAIQHLTRAVVGAGGSVMISLDLSHLRSWPQLRPFVALSPAIEVAAKLIEGIDARLSGRIPRASETYLEVLAMVQRPDRAGMDASHAGYVALGVMNGLGMFEAMTGSDRCLAWADRISVSPSYEVNGMLLRMLHHLWNGDAAAADQAKKAAARLRIQNTGRPMYEGQHLIGEIQALAASRDLTRMRHVRDEIAPLAGRHAHWVPVLTYAQAEYARLTGDIQKALRLIEDALRLAPCGMHQIWPAASVSHIGLLLALERSQLALQVAEAAQLLAQRVLGYEPEALTLARALALAHCKQSGAAELADRVIEHMREVGFGKLHLGNAHEVRARVALAVQDSAAFHEHAAICGELYQFHKNPALTAKWQLLLQDGARTFNDRSATLAGDVQPASDSDAHRMRALASCEDTAQRAHLALEIILLESHAAAGCLFTLDKQNTVCSAKIGDFAVPDSWAVQLTEYIEAQCTPAVTQALDPQGAYEAPWMGDEGEVYRPLLLCHQEAGTLIITGVAVLQSHGDVSVGRASDAAAAISRCFAGAGAYTIATRFD